MKLLQNLGSLCIALGIFVSGALVCTYECKAQESETSEVEETKDTQVNDMIERVGYKCSSEISYTWQPLPPKTQAKPAPGKAKQTSKSPTPRIVIVETVSHTEQKQTAAKSALKIKIQQAKTMALEKCHYNHNNMANCFGGKMRKHSSEYKLLDFQSRHTLLEALTEDCRAMAGQCLKANASEIICFETTHPQTKKADDSQNSAIEEEKK